MWLVADVPFLTTSYECLSFCPNSCFTKRTIFPCKGFFMFGRGTSWCSKMHPTLPGPVARWPHDRGGELGHFSAWSAQSTWERLRSGGSCCQKTWFSTCQNILTCCFDSRAADAGCRNGCFSIFQLYRIVNEVKKDFEISNLPSSS